MKAKPSDHTPNMSANGDRPLVWVLQGHRAGDNLQVQALVEGLGWPWQSKILKWQKNWLNKLPQWTPFYGRSANLNHLTSDAKEAFQSPWPDLVISIGWRSVPVARWIKDRCNARLVHLGRPRAPLTHFDLVLTTPQYRLPSTPNVVQLSGPLTTLSQDKLATAATAWKARLSHLPRPWIAVFVGGDTPSLKFPPSAATALAKAVNAHAASCEGSLLVLTSPRTSDEITKMLRSTIRTPSFFHEWNGTADNPYAATLALADQFIVTNDSISMTQEAALTGRPVHIFPLASNESSTNQVLLAWDRKMREGSTPMAKTYQGALRNGMLYPPKSPADYFELLMQDGRAVGLGSTNAPHDRPPLMSENERAIQAVQALLEPSKA